MWVIQSCSSEIFFPWVYQEYLEKHQPYPKIRLSKVSEDNTKISECVSTTRLRRYVFFKQCDSLKNHRELGKVYCHLDYMIWPFLSVDWFDPTLGQKLIKYCIHYVPTLYTGAVGTFTHTQNKFEIFLNKKYMCSANSQVIPVIGKAGKRFVIKLHPCLSVGTFKPQRFSPKKNNVRQNWFNGEEGVAEDGSGRLKVILISTCNYCHSVNKDIKSNAEPCTL